MLIDLLRNDPVISQYFCDECKENGVGVEIDTTISNDDIIIIKVDNYYNDLAENRPVSPDCLIVQRCKGDSFILYIVELRNIDSPDGFTIKEIKGKFITCLEDFMSIRFAHHFHRGELNFLNIHLIFISDPYNFKNAPVKQEKMRGLKIDALMAQRIPKYFGKHLYIDHKIPDPKINNCKTA